MAKNIKLGLRENWEQFTILIIVNAFVGGMVGMERTIFPQFAEASFGIASKTAILSFITAFGISKAIANYYTGKLANLWGRRNLLLLGWAVAIPVPFLLMYAPAWSWVVFANILLGLSQGLTWSSTVVMKIDLVGEKDRGLAMGLNEFAGYLAVGGMAFISGTVASEYGITPYPFYLGIFISITGFIVSWFWVKDTREFVKLEAQSNQTLSGPTAVETPATLTCTTAAATPSLKQRSIFIETTFTNKTLSSITQAGLVNNLNDGMIWGLLPILLASIQFKTENIAIITAIYPIVWGIGQLFTGKLSDIVSKKKLLFWGMLLQGLAIVFLPYLSEFYVFVIIGALLGLGTAMVYPTFLATIAQVTTPQKRAESIGTFRLWRDLGYAIGAILSGITADIFGIPTAIILIGIITLTSAVIIFFRMPADKSHSLKSSSPNSDCISKNKVLEIIGKGKKVKILDVRSAEEFEEGHIPTAMHIPISQLSIRISQIDPQYTWITACGKGGGRSIEAAKILKSHSINAFWLCGGSLGWIGNS